MQTIRRQMGVDSVDEVVMIKLDEEEVDHTHFSEGTTIEIIGLLNKVDPSLTLAEEAGVDLYFLFIVDLLITANFWVAAAFIGVARRKRSLLGPRAKPVVHN